MKSILRSIFVSSLYIGLYFVFFYGTATLAAQNGQPPIRLSTFDIDATPPVGSQLAYNPVVNTYDLSLRAKGLVLYGAGEPIVLVAVDWIGIYNEDHDEFVRALASAAGTSQERVAIHCIHQHDAPRGNTNSDFVLATLHRLEMAVANAPESAVPISHMGLGRAEVFKVASNRRPLGPDGMTLGSRLTTCRDPFLRAQPEGTIDPMVDMVSFWNEDEPVAVLSFYATHPQSYYRTGIPNPDFPGIARFMRQLEVPDALHVHFTGAGGNVGAGKYNDGSHENRGILAERLADGMKRAWEATERIPIRASDIDMTTEPVLLPADSIRSHESAGRLDYWNRYKAGKTIDLQCLALVNARILFMPGELFVEYQLAAKEMRPDLFVTMAAYGDVGPRYIPTAIVFEQGGNDYEFGATHMKPEVEGILMTAMKKLLKK